MAATMIKKIFFPLGRSSFAMLCFLAQTGPAVSTESTRHDISPDGLWITVDNHSHKPVSQVRIWSENGVWFGRVENIFDNSDSNTICNNCKGDKKDQPVRGMTILWDMKRDGDSFIRGKILDPGNGKTYSASMKLLGSGNQLEIRKYIGFPAIGRSQIWQRRKDSGQNSL